MTSLRQVELPQEITDVHLVGRDFTISGLEGDLRLIKQDRLDLDEFPVTIVTENLSRFQPICFLGGHDVSEAG